MQVEPPHEEAAVRECGGLRCPRRVQIRPPKAAEEVRGVPCLSCVLKNLLDVPTCPQTQQFARVAELAEKALGGGRDGMGGEVGGIGSSDADGGGPQSFRTWTADYASNSHALTSSSSDIHTTHTTTPSATHTTTTTTTY